MKVAFALDSTIRNSANNRTNWPAKENSRSDPVTVASAYGPNNFPQERVTDHRIGLTLHKLTQTMEGSLDEIIDALNIYYQSEALKQSHSA